ncbi:PREDICTED: allantoinase-like [Scomber scombrus]|uniref:PREDICTED: allantoinase-like n=1 Tax=Scomber scombrus TaxID=13677 RepID=A0AAV1PCI8_SCOSC
MPSEEFILLRKANKKIAELKEDIHRLSNELKKKDSLLSSFMEVASGQSKQLASFNVPLQDTAVWDPSACPRLSCSTRLLTMRLHLPRTWTRKLHLPTPQLSLHWSLAALQSSAVLRGRQLYGLHPGPRPHLPGGGS